MKRLLFLLVILCCGCALTKAQIPIKLADGTNTTASVSSYRLFMKANISYMPGTGLNYSSGEQLSSNLMALEGLANIAVKMQGLPTP